MNIHSKIVSRETSVFANFSAKSDTRVGHLNAFFCPGGRAFDQANLQKFKCPGGCPGGGGGEGGRGDVELSHRRNPSGNFLSA